MFGCVHLCKLAAGTQGVTSVAKRADNRAGCQGEESPTFPRRTGRSWLSLAGEVTLSVSSRA